MIPRPLVGAVAAYIARYGYSLITAPRDLVRQAIEAVSGNSAVLAR
ncbi:MAG: hypothetical protein ACM31L_19630 [Actinomycetota bacterium]